MEIHTPALPKSHQVPQLGISDDVRDHQKI